jgi:hypothetical protein
MDVVQGHLATYLRAASGSKLVPHAGEALQPSDALNAADSFLQDYINNFLRQLLYELDAFGDSVPAHNLLAALNTVTLSYQDGSTGPAGDALAAQAETLVKGTPGATVTMPREWPAVTDDQAAQILLAAKASLDTRLATIRPQEEKFSIPSRRYRVRAFVRVKQDDDCPPKIVWSPYSEPFTIAPWYDNSDVAPVQIVLPDATDQNFLKSLKPNVSFVVPPNLFNMLQQTKLKGLIDGSAPSGGGIALDWICGFSIPIITFCAFIVLNIFLQLLDIVFFWMLFVKICIPFPRKK